MISPPGGGSGAAVFGRFVSRIGPSTGAGAGAGGGGADACSPAGAASPGAAARGAGCDAPSPSSSMRRAFSSALSTRILNPLFSVSTRSACSSCRALRSLICFCWSRTCSRSASKSRCSTTHPGSSSGERRPEQGQPSCDHQPFLPRAAAGSCGTNKKNRVHPMLRASPLSRRASPFSPSEPGGLSPHHGLPGRTSPVTNVTRSTEVAVPRPGRCRVSARPRMPLSRQGLIMDRPGRSRRDFLSRQGSGFGCAEAGSCPPHEQPDPQRRRGGKAPASGPVDARSTIR